MTVSVHYDGTALVSIESDRRNYGVDGKVATFYEHYTTAEGALAWFGQDFGRVRRLTGVRFVRRMNYASRATGALFQTADDAAFTENVQTVFTCPNTTENFTVFEATFDSPVNARYVRVATTGANCCNFNEVEWTGDFQPEVGQFSAADPTPAVRWSVSAAEGVTSSRAEWSYAADGGFSTLGDACAGAGDFTASNAAARVGVPVYYRVRRQFASGGEDATPAVRFVRGRRLDRDPADETVLLTGVTLLPCCQYSTDGALGGVAGLANAFDGDTATFPDFWKLSGESFEVLMGVRLPEAAFVSAVYAHSRDSTTASVTERLGYLKLRAAATEADYAATQTELLGAIPKSTRFDWYACDLNGATNRYEYLFLYEGPLNAKSTFLSYGNAAEIRFYGWTRADEAAAGLVLAAPTVAPAAADDQSPVVCWTAGEMTLSSRVECAYQPEGPYWTVGDAQTGAGSFAVTNGAALTGITCHYRIGYTTVLGEAVTESVTLTPGRILQTSGDLSVSQYADLTGISLNNPTPYYAFDLNEATYPDVYDKNTWAAFNPVIGRKLKTPARITAAYALTRTDTMWTRLKSVAFYGAATEADFIATNTVRLAASAGDNLVNGWNRYPSDDQTNEYACAFAYSETGYGWCGNAAEIRFAGFTEADRLASGAVYAPAGVTVEPGTRRITLRWTSAVNAGKIRVERRPAGEESWTTVAAAADPAAGAFTDSGLKNRTAYEYRLTAIGLEDRMLVSADVVRGTTLPDGLVVILH